MRTFVTFEWATDENDQLDADGDVVVPGGRAIMVAVREALAHRGLQVTQVEQHDSYGWCFDTEIDGARAWSMLQFSQPWLIVTTVPLRWLQKLKGRRVHEAEKLVCRALHEALSAMPLASKVQWFTRTDFERSGGRDGEASP